MKQSDGMLSRSNERLLKHYKHLLREYLGAAVIYPEDRQPVPPGLHRQVAFGMKNIDWKLREHSPASRDSRLYYLMHDIFSFKVETATIARYYYMSAENEILGK